jgi:hypothetical protein
VFYGDVVRDEISGLDVSRCESINVVVRHGEHRFCGSEEMHPGAVWS